MLAQLESLPEELWDRAPLIHFLPGKKSVQEPVLVSLLRTVVSRSIRARSRSKIALTRGALFLIQLPLEP
jgi:hypothetical protein